MHSHESHRACSAAPERPAHDFLRVKARALDRCRMQMRPHNTAHMHCALLPPSCPGRDKVNGNSTQLRSVARYVHHHRSPSAPAHVAAHPQTNTLAPTRLPVTSAPARAGMLVSRGGVRSHVAIKVISTWDDFGEPSQRLREVARQEALDHCRWMARLRTSILPVRAVQDDTQAGCVRIVTDLYDSTLSQWMKRRPDGRPLEHEWVRPL